MEIQSANTAPSTAMTTPTAHHLHLWAGTSFSFHDVLDAINPLQHLPIIATIYRHLTGDTIGTAARVVGDTLYGGPVGLVSSLANAFEVYRTGSDIGDHLLAMVDGSSSKASAAPTLMASAKPAQASVATGSGAIAAAPAGAGAIQAASYSAPAGGIPQAATTTTSMIAPDPLPGVPSYLQATPTPVTAPAAQTTAAQAPMPTPLFGGAPRGFAIDTSAQGIAAMRAKTQNSSGVPFQMPAGVMLTNQPQPLQSPVAVPQTSLDFAQKMKQGLAKYQALLAEQAAHPGLAAQPSS